MISQQKLQEQDVWEAWIEFDPSATHFGTLYICGELSIHPGKLESFTRKIQTDYGTQLVVELPERPNGRCRVKEFFYSEPLNNPAKYHSICIYAGKDVIARFQDIEIMI